MRRPLTCLAAAALLAGCTTEAPPAPRAHQPAAVPTSFPDVSGGDPGFDADVHDLIGKAPPAWNVGPWLNGGPVSLADLKGKVVLVRWFMSPSCPMCSATAPSLVLLDQRYRERGLAVVGMYHHKDEEPLDPEKVKGYVAHFGYTFPVAIDPDWRTMKAWWQSGHAKREYTSVSFVLDRKGLVRHVHLGGRFAPGSPDFEVVEARIKSLLEEGVAAR